MREGETETKRSPRKLVTSVLESFRRGLCLVYGESCSERRPGGSRLSLAVEVLPLYPEQSRSERELTGTGAAPSQPHARKSSSMNLQEPL